MKKFTLNQKVWFVPWNFELGVMAGKITRLPKNIYYQILPNNAKNEKFQYAREEEVFATKKKAIVFLRKIKNSELAAEKSETKFVAKAEVWISISKKSNYADGMGEAQREIEYLIESLSENPKNNILISRAAKVKIFSGELKEKNTECDKALYFRNFQDFQNSKWAELHNGIH